MEMHEALSARPRKMKKEFRAMELRPAEGGGAVATHHFSGPHESETHVFGADEGEKLAAHVMQHMGMKGGAPETGVEESDEEE